MNQGSPLQRISWGQTNLPAWYSTKEILPEALPGEREGDRAHTAGDKQGKAELGSSKSLYLMTLHQAKIWPWQGTGEGRCHHSSSVEKSKGWDYHSITILGEHRSLCLCIQSDGLWKIPGTHVE